MKERVDDTETFRGFIPGVHICMKKEFKGTPELLEYLKTLIKILEDPLISNRWKEAERRNKYQLITSIEHIVKQGKISRDFFKEGQSSQ